MEKTVSERIMEFLKGKRISVNALCKELGLKQSTINGQLNGTVALSMDTVSHLLDAYSDLSAEWLLRGVGSMEHQVSPTDAELQAVCIEQAKEILRLKLKIAELEGEKKDRA